MKSALITVLSFTFVAIQAFICSLAMADEQSNHIQNTIDTKHRWILWEFVGNLKHPVAYAKGAYLTKERCGNAFPMNVDEVKNYSCLPIGVNPIFEPRSRHASHAGVPSKLSSPTNNERDRLQK